MDKPVKARVLIIDDSNFNIMQLTDILEPEYQVLSINNAKESLSFTEKHMPDVILLDIIMPDMDGYSVIAALKLSEKTRKIPVIIITTLSGAAYEEKGLALGAVDYISSPFSPAVIRHRIRNQLSITENMRALKNREKMLDALNKTSVLFLAQSNEDFEGMMTVGVKLIADAAGLDRVSIWRNSMKSDGLHTGQIYRWDKDEGGTTIPNMGLGDIIINQFAPRWGELFNKGEHINGPANLLPEADMLKGFGVVSVFVMPVFIDASLWGFVLFEDRHHERYFDSDSIEMMRSASLLYVNSIIRAEMIKDTEYYANLLRTVNEVANFLLDTDTDFFAETLTQSMILIADLTKTDSVTIWENHQRDDGRLYCSRLHGWANQELNIPDKLYSYDEYFQGWEETLVEGNCINNILSDTAPKVQKFLNQSGIKSFLSVPMFIKGEFWGWVGFGDSINERVFTDDEINIMQSVSLMMASALNRDVQVTKIRNALEDARAANKAKSDFLAAMSHEIRTPMNAIMGMTSIGISSKEPEQIHNCFIKIKEASNHLLGIINDTLDISKIEAGKLELSPVVFDFRKLFKRVENVIGLRILERGQNLTINIDSDISKFLFGDDQRLIQAIANIVGNANKFTPKGGVIHIEARLLGEEEIIGKTSITTMSEIEISVQDNGIGISREQQARLFQPYQQAESGITREYGGTGLGLSISKRIVQMMGGDISIESEIGTGSKFIITIKMERRDEMGKSHEDSTLDNRIFKGRRILLAEDMEINREIVLAILEPTQLIVDCAENGIEAVDMFKQTPDMYDLIFMDVQMPKMNGCDATINIRALDAPNAKTIPIIAMTANVFKDDIELYLKSGMNGHIGKPLNTDDIIKILNKYI